MQVVLSFPLPPLRFFSVFPPLKWFNLRQSSASFSVSLPFLPRSHLILFNRPTANFKRLHARCLASSNQLPLSPSPPLPVSFPSPMEGRTDGIRNTFPTIDFPRPGDWPGFDTRINLAEFFMNRSWNLSANRILPALSSVIHGRMRKSRSNRVLFTSARWYAVQLSHRVSRICEQF